MSKKTEWYPIEDHAYIHGWTARVGKRKVEVIRAYAGHWRVFCYIGNKAVRVEDRTYGQATARAKGHSWLHATSLQGASEKC